MIASANVCSGYSPFAFVFITLILFMWILLLQNFKVGPLFHNRKFIACLILICIVTSCRQCDDIQAHNRSSYSDLKRDQSM